jgi:hypothetical protein
MLPFSFFHQIKYSLVAIALLMLTTAPHANAWGAKGHRIIGAIATHHLTASSKAAIHDILQGDDLATASTWADEMRSAKDNVEFWGLRSAPWHYINLPPNGDYASAEKNPLGDAVVAMETFSAILRDEPIPPGSVRAGLEFYYGNLDANKAKVKAFALRFLVHILGDLQQPLHMGYASDRGGNEVKVLWFGKASNLHTLWDSQLIDQADLSYSEYAERLNNRIGRMAATEIHRVQRADTAQWLKESRQLLDQIYAKHDGTNDLSYDYIAEFTPTVEAQLVKGGLRTAHFLNSLFER